MRIPRVVALPVAGAALIASMTSCTYWSSSTLNLGRWNADHRAAVTVGADAFDSVPGTYPGHDPSMGNAVDLFFPGGGRTAASAAKGWAVANAARANARKYKVHYVVYRQHIWNVQRNAEGWRLMANRGSWTANHMDHVHVSFY